LNTIDQLGDLEVVPRRLVTYCAVTLDEMDTDAVIARRPKVALGLTRLQDAFRCTSRASYLRPLLGYWPWSA
jgi:hypothetical protein